MIKNCFCDSDAWEAVGRYKNTVFQQCRERNRFRRWPLRGMRDSIKSTTSSSWATTGKEIS